jgi:hypothetical protein
VKVTTNPPVPVKSTFVLELSEAEALVIHSLLGRTGGEVAGVSTYQMYDALDKVLAPVYGDDYPKIKTGVIKFEEKLS